MDVISDAPILVDLTDPKTSLQCPPKRLNWADVIAENSTEKALHRLIQAGQQALSGRNPSVPNNKAPLVLPELTTPVVYSGVSSNYTFDSYY